MKEKENRPAISIIVPVYNVERYLRDCLDSILSQRFSDFEIICVNDGSTDASVGILEEYKKKDSRIKVIHQKNSGLGNARNTGLNNASAKYICFVDSDDLLKKNALEILFNEAEKSNVEALCFNTEIFYENDECKKRGNYEKYYIRTHVREGVYEGKTLYNIMSEKEEYIHSAWLLFLNREWIKNKKISFFEGIIYEDVYFTLQVFLQADRFKYITDLLYIYRVRSNSILDSQFKPQKCILSLKSQLKNYSEIRKLICLYTEDDNVKNSLITMQQGFLASIRNMDMVIMKHGMVLDDIAIECAHIAIELGLGCYKRKYSYNGKIYLNGFDYAVEKAQKIVLYGAGKIGKEVFEYLRRKGWSKKVLAFGISEEKEKTLINGVPQRYVGDILTTNKEIDLIILAAKYEYQVEMLEMLKDYNFKEYLAIDFYMERLIREYITK